MSARTITSREMLRYQTCEQLLGCNNLTPQVRYDQARVAQCLRNFFFTATLHPDAAPVIDRGIISRTPAYSEPLVLTDLISMFEPEAGIEPNFQGLEVFEYGGQERSSGLDYFGLSGRVPQRYILKHEKNHSVVSSDVGALDRQGRYIGYVPRLLAPYQQLGFNYGALTAGILERPFLQVGLRSVRALTADNPYAHFSRSTEASLRRYIDGSVPETFFLEATLPLASFPAVGATAQIKTPQMERPLLVLGATSNVEGVQAELVDESKYYVFTSTDVPLNAQPQIPLYKSVPLSLWACNSDFRNYNIYNMWAVPHLLEPGTQFVIRITNGLTPDLLGAFTETILTRSEQPLRIVFLCRTV